jgi:uncharacterized protein YggE
MHIFQQSLFKYLLALVLLGTVCSLGAYTYLTFKQAATAQVDDLTISVTGEGEAVAVPDIGQFSFAVTAEAKTAEVAQNDSAEAMNEIIAYLAEVEIAETDIRTTNYQLNPQYRYEQQNCTDRGYCPPGERVLTGYQVRQMVEVKIRDLEAASGVISGVGSRGATNISGLRFTIDDESELQAEARSKALADAKEKASALASELGMSLGRLVGYDEGAAGRPKPYSVGNTMMFEESASDSVQPALPTGENTLKSNVTLTYRLR